MKKIICPKYTVNIPMFFFLFFSIQNIFGVVFNFKVLGGRGRWYEATFQSAIIYFAVAILIYVLSKYFCREEIIYKCTTCGEVYDERSLKEKICPNCQTNLIDLDIYLKTWEA
jgi:hypothetical protein